MVLLTQLSPRIMTLRENREYKFICETLGQLNTSLMDGLLAAEVPAGLALEVSSQTTAMRL
jgi:hypothetical protein